MPNLTLSAANRINVVADREGWPTLCSPHLEFLTPQLRDLLGVWQAKRGARTMPSRAELSLRDLKFAAGNIGFVEVVRERGRVRFKVKLLGGQLESFIAPLTGQFVDEAVPLLIASKWATMWTAVIEDRVPLRTVGLLEFRDQRWFVGETLFAPLAADGETPDALVVCCYFYLCDDPDAFGGGISKRLIDQLGERVGRKRVIV